MPTTKSAHEYYRQLFELVYGKPIKHAYWQQIRFEICTANLRLNAETIRAYASFKRENPRKALTKEAIERLDQFSQQYHDSPTITGRELANLMRTFHPTLKTHSIYKAFSHAGEGFSADKPYSFTRAYLALTYALTIRPKTGDCINV